MTRRVGTAGWSIPRACADAFPKEGSGLQRYAAVMDAVEINSSFYRSHSAKVWERWAASVPAAFRFALKFSKEATHERKLVECDDIIARFLGETNALGDKRGPILIQLPPSLAFDPLRVATFLDGFRARYDGPLAIEPRQIGWFEEAPDRLLAEYEVARVAADPARHPLAGEPGGTCALSYWRLHGSPAMYRTPYAERCETIAAAVGAASGEAWCIFDNTMTGAATVDALTVRALLASRAGAPAVATPSRRSASDPRSPAGRRR